MPYLNFVKWCLHISASAQQDIKDKEANQSTEKGGNKFQSLVIQIFIGMNFRVVGTTHPTGSMPPTEPSNTLQGVLEIPSIEGSHHLNHPTHFRCPY
jgi:hypothetical protein